MKTLTLKLPEVLEARLEAYSRESGQSRSEIVRRALRQYFSNAKKGQSGSFLDLSKDLVGSIQGPSDLSVNNKHFDGYGS